MSDIQTAYDELYVYTMGRPKFILQHVDRILGQRKRCWPAISMPADRGNFIARDVMAAFEGAERDAAIDCWCETVWKTFGTNHDLIVRLLAENGIG